MGSTYVTSVGLQVDVSLPPGELYATSVGAQVDIGLPPGELYVSSIGLQVDVLIAGGRLKRWDGAEWVAHPLKLNSVEHPLKAYVDGDWIS